MNRKVATNILILGGTADGRKLASRLHQHGVSVIYSVAGLVRMPDVDCKVVSGGFSQFGGLEAYIKAQAISVILDVTHPYAQTMSTTAVNTAKALKIPCWRFHREAWQAEEGDNWQLFQQWDALNQNLIQYSSVFLTCGQLTQQQVDSLASNTQQRSMLRTAVEPKHELPNNMQWIKAIGPFSLDDELALMQKHNVDVLVSKNSGGDSTAAKLHAARKMNIPVLMLDRPELPAADREFISHEDCEAYVLSAISELKSSTGNPSEGSIGKSHAL